ncbi:MULTISPECIES: DUF2786 domain-containing protein [Pseudonocardia]|uniref:Uncharacterized protein n=2 Tax=Pseudonocardia TaxID=1847 RepID=A0A1Y2MVV9_PSEAH|nr:MULTISPECIES: DUF2786 domain-containing protein [Pseudonocardia]OSY39119.1 hypothetical protein BG845_03689 [Pseudonocardia autotrophica]TDN71285.1 uncharacterized protein DUF2786 [Pseudonocardia autotrophica]BBG01958.1 hypothetical protein Pdca_31670 [Pseudonocardia autotrophica]GEC23122.1 hypothetical protein PSA01_01510 [Pseudonocardia saturnea]
MSTLHDTAAAPGPEQQEARLDRIRKLLAKAERAGTAAEAQIYTDKAVELMARHGVDEAVLAATGPPGHDPIGGVRIAVHDPYSAPKARLLGWTAAALRCRWVMHDSRSGKVAAVTVFGFASDRERVELLYTSLLLQASTHVARLRPPDPRESVAAYRRSWLYGFAARVHERLCDAERDAVGESDAAARGATSAELVLADRGDRVAQAYSEQFSGLRRARAPQVSGSGYRSGAEAADRADLGGTRLGERAHRRALRG